jgi:hypothetical protein
MIIHTLKFGRDLFSESVAPSSWRTMRSLACRALLSLLSAVKAVYMTGYEWEEASHSRDLWVASVEMALIMLREENLAMLRMSPQQTRTSTWRVWSQLGMQATSIVSELQSCVPTDLSAEQRTAATRAVVDACMTNVDMVPSLVPLLDGLLQQEWQADASLSAVSFQGARPAPFGVLNSVGLQVCSDLVTSLDAEVGNSRAIAPDVRVAEKKPSPQLVDSQSLSNLSKFIFFERLRELQTDDDPESGYREGLLEVLDSLEGYLSLVLRMGDPSLAPNEYGMLALETMEYAKRQGEVDLVAKWCQRLYTYLQQEGHRVGAGLSLAREASCLDWAVVAGPKSEKEQLYLRAIDELGERVCL